MAGSARQAVEGLQNLGRASLRYARTMRGSDVPPRLPGGVGAPKPNKPPEAPRLQKPHEAQIRLPKEPPRYGRSFNIRSTVNDVAPNTHPRLSFLSGGTSQPHRSLHTTAPGFVYTPPTSQPEGIFKSFGHKPTPNPTHMVVCPFEIGPEGDSQFTDRRVIPYDTVAISA
jgi:hypothetical protein